MKVQSNNGRLFISCTVTEYHPMRSKLRHAGVKFRHRGGYVLEVISFPTEELRSRFMETCAKAKATA